MDTNLSLRPDILGLDAQSVPVLVAEVKTRPIESGLVEAQLTDYLRRFGVNVPYAMVVDRRTIRVFHWDGKDLLGPVYEAPTAEILSFYDEEFSKKEIFEFYLQTLVEAWLRDVAYHWKSEAPPGYRELERI